MLRHHLKAAIRNLVKNKLFTAINFIGLSVSIGVFLALTGYVTYEFSFDKFYEGGDRIYRIDYYEYQEGQPVLQSARTHDRTALLAGEYVPQIEAVARVYNEKAFVYTEDIRIVDQDMLFADSSFFKVFGLKLISGSADNALTPPNAVVISRSQAEVYFGKTDPMGKILYFNERLPMTVTGVFEDIPTTTSINFDFLLSWSTMPYYGWITRDGTFNDPWTFTFIKLRDQATDINAVNDQLSLMAKQHITTLEKRSHTGRYVLRPYQDLHHSPGLSGEVKPGTSKALLYAMASLGVFILIAAWINYVNLSLARSLERANQIGIQKVFGATRAAVSGQFIVEAFILSLASFFSGYVLFILFTGPFSSLLFSGGIFFTLSKPMLLIYLVAFVAVTTLVAFYPAWFISKFKPALILKNKLGTGHGKAALLHQVLMVFQLFLAVAIVGMTLIAERQVSFMRNFDSGFNSQQTISLRAPASTNSDSLRHSRFTSFRGDVMRHHAFRSGTASMNIPGQEIRFHDEGVLAVGSKNDKKQSFWVMWVDEGYQETFGLTLASGRNFRQKELGTTCIINATAAIALGYRNPADAVNTTIVTSQNGTATIIGVWKDYHHESLRKPVDPILFFHHHPHEYGYYSFNVQSREGDYLQVLQQLWKKHYPNDQFIYYFMDSFFTGQYQSDELFGSLLRLFSVISMVVSSLGLFGMASLAMVKRTREIGVRKVLGATVWNILIMLSKAYVRLTIISCVFAFPLAYYLTFRWLEGFSYKITVQWWMIGLPGIIVLVATVVTIAGQSVKAAIANPARSLRDQ